MLQITPVSGSLDAIWLESGQNITQTFSKCGFWKKKTLGVNRFNLFFRDFAVEHYEIFKGPVFKKSAKYELRLLFDCCFLFRHITSLGVRFGRHQLYGP